MSSVPAMSAVANGGSTTSGSANSPKSTAANSAYLLNDPKLREILLSDVGVDALLARLKQSIYTAKEIATYIKKMATIEVEHSAHLKKASRTMSDLFKRPEVKKGTCQTQIINIMKSTDRYGDAGVTFIDTMHKIHDELLEVVRSMERQRKTVKEVALRHEKNLLDMEREVDKAKAKYDAACEDLEKARTSDPSKSKLGFKNKSEEELHRRMTISESDYQQKVDQCQRMRQELVNKLRVDTVRKLQGLVLETDNAMSLQLIRFSNLFETLQLNRGFVIAPIKPQNSPTANLSIKDMAAKIDSELDFYNFVCGIPKTKTVLNRAPAVFKKHPTLGGSKGSGSVNGTHHASNSYSNTGNSYSNNSNSYSNNSYGNAMGNARNHTAPDPRNTHRSRPSADFSAVGDRKVSTSSQASTIPAPSVVIGSGTAKTGPVLGKTPGLHVGAATTPASPALPASPPSLPPNTPSSHQPDITGAAPNVPPNVPPSAPLSREPPLSSSNPSQQSSSTIAPSLGSSTLTGPTTVGSSPSLPPKAVYDPSKHGLAVYGTPLEDILEYEEGTVPRVVYQCVQAIDNFGLEVEGIYRTNGNKDQVAEIRNEFDIDAAAVDMLRPKDGVNDIHSVASALKQYLQSLPDPLLTSEFHQEFLQAATIQDDVHRRDSIHAIINNLPDPNYTTLRYLIFHLYRVQERSDINKMDVTNLGIIWGPILMKADHQNVGEMAVESRVLQTILINAYAIFEAE